MEFRADGGGDTPESVNRALHDAVHRMSWSTASQAYQVIFLVGDAPPQEYAGEPNYPEILKTAAARGIVVNTIQCGDMPTTVAPWTRIAALGDGRYFQVEQAGGAVAFATPFDAELAELSAQLDDTRLYFGSDEEKAAMERKVGATRKLNEYASVSARASRGAFNAAAAGRENFLGDKELVAAVTTGEVDVAELEPEALPEALKPMAPAEQRAAIAELAGKREAITNRIRALAEERNAYLKSKVDEDGGAVDSLDQKLFDTVRDQAGEAGLAYADDAPTY